MSHLSVELYQPKHKNIWDDFVAKAKNSTFLFYRDFMEYHQDRFDDFSLLVFKDEKLLALLPANRTGTIVHSHQGLTYGSIILSKNAKLVEVSIVFKELLQFLDTNSISELNVKMTPSIYYKLPSDELQYLAFILKAELTRRDTLSVISNSNEKNSYSKIRNRQIKKAESENLIIKEETSFELFWEKILIPNLKQTHKSKPVHSVIEITNLKQQFSNNIKQFNVYKNNEIIAGVTIFETDRVAHAQYISSNKIGQELGALDLLFDFFINTEYIHKAYFDFGISNENNGKNINQGLQYWKESFGARTITQDFYKIDTSNHKLLDNIWI